MLSWWHNIWRAATNSTGFFLWVETVWHVIESACWWLWTNYLLPSAKVLASISGVLMAVTTLAWATFDLEQILNDLAASISSFSGSIQSLPVTTFVAKLNKVFPLVEFCGFVVVLMLIRLAMLLVRVILRFSVLFS